MFCLFQLLAFVHHGNLRKTEHSTKDREAHLVPVLQEINKTHKT